MKRFAPVLLALSLGCSPAHTMDTSAGNLTVTKMVDQLDDPWALGFLPEGGMLITERAGRLLHVEDGARREIAGLPEVAARGQGGLMDVLIPRDFAQDRTLFLTFSKPQSRGAGTAILRATLAPGADRLSDTRVIFEMEPGSSGGGISGHGSSRGRTVISTRPSGNAVIARRHRTCRARTARSSASAATGRCRTTTPSSTGRAHSPRSGPTATATRKARRWMPTAIYG